MSPATTSTDAQLQWEARWGLPAGIAAGLGAVLLLAAQPLQAGAIGTKDGLDAVLTHVHSHGSAQYATGAAIFASGLCLSTVVFYLYGATRARRPALLTAALYLGVLGGLLVGIGAVGHAFGIIHVASDFARSTVPKDLSKITDAKDYLKAVSPEERAKDLKSGSVVPVFDGIIQAGALALGLALVLVNLNAMRAGLLTQFMGVIGIIVGVLFGLFGGPPPIIATFWLGAMALLFLDRWPGGRGEAWETGKPGEWLTRGQIMRAEAQADREREHAAEAEAEVADTPSPARRRKRKRR